MNIIKQAWLSGFDVVVPSVKNFNTNFVYDDIVEKYNVFGKELEKRSDKIPFYTSYYGLGTIVKTKIASKGLLISEKKNGLLILKINFKQLEFLIK